MKSPRIAIIGAGPAGLTLARILHLHGLHATVFEGEPCSAARSQGGSLDMHPESGQYAIECAGLTAEFNRIARYDDQESRVYDKYGTLRFVDTDISAGDRPEVDRGKLRQMLLDSLPPNLIRWDHQLSAIHAHHDPGRQETFHLVFRNGETETFDLVVGADGAWSRVRPLLSDVCPVYSGVAFVELGIDDVDIRHPELARLVGHGLTFAVGDSRALISHRDANAHIGIYAALRAPEDWINIGGLDLSSPDALRSSLAAHFDSWSPDLLNLIYQAGDRMTPRAIYALPVGHRWQHRPGVTLLGDAGHLMSPFGGDGANLTMQDAADLALALVSNKDWNTAVQSYETAMFPRAEQCAARSKKQRRRSLLPGWPPPHAAGDGEPSSIAAARRPAISPICENNFVKRIAILGSTGSIGTSTLSICESFPDRYQPVALAAGRNLEAALAQCLRWRPRFISVATEALAADLALRLKQNGLTGTEVLHGTPGTVAVATHPEVDFVVSAIVGVAGLEATYAAILAGKTIGLANKECLVAAGDLIMRAAREGSVALLPIDSEHNAVHQAMRGGKHSEVKQIWLTASGGPFRSTPLVDFDHITPQQALKHPTWVMGQRITIDSATMMNKGFEVIEACRLFDLPPEQVRVTVHPQSTVHSLVEFIDGSILAQISVTDMRLPILYALSFPDRPAAPPVTSTAPSLTFDLAALAHLDFAPPDLDRFPCLRLAYQAALSPSACIALNATDEIAVAAFLDGRIPFLGIPRTIEQVLSLTPSAAPTSIQEVLEADQAARIRAAKFIAQPTLAGA